MKPEDRLGLLYRVARLRYEEDKKNREIAKLIGQSEAQVGKLLREAKKRRIVEIRINLPRLTVLKERLKGKLGLRDVLVVPFQDDYKDLLNELARASAEYFDEKVHDGASVALGGGYLMYRMVNMLPERSRNIEIYPAAIIARGPTTAHIDPLVVVNSLWAKSGQPKDKIHYVTVTPLDKVATLKDLREHYRDLLKNRVVNGLFNDMKKTDWVFASIGALDADPAYIRATNNSTQNLLDEIELDDSTLKAKGVVGDIVYSFFDNSGGNRPDWNIVATIGVEHLKRMVKENRNVVVVVGCYKLRALRAILQGKICNILITDSRAAEQLLADFAE